MPFPDPVRTDALVRSRRVCCVCHNFAGRDAVVHHIVQEADGGSNTLDNAILLCSRCHGEAGHYNPRHPLGTKYSPEELRRHRDDWWAYCEDYEPNQRPADFGAPTGLHVRLHSRKVGILWSQQADVASSVEVVEFEARYVTADRLEDLSIVRSRELFQREDDTFLVYDVRIHRGNWSDAYLHGAERNEPLTLARLQDEFAELASRAGLPRVRRL
ncbi:MAG: HNH endonuclease [Polyangiaceae bacterium]|nr:HNH endonuclease [Polyangiaceae bacterium]